MIRFLLFTAALCGGTVVLTGSSDDIPHIVVNLCVIQVFAQPNIVYF